MLVVKKLFSGNYLKKLHYIPCDNSESNEKNENNIDNGNIILNEEKANQFYLISIYESSIDINKGAVGDMKELGENSPEYQKQDISI